MAAARDVCCTGWYDLHNRNAMCRIGNSCHEHALQHVTLRACAICVLILYGYVCASMCVCVCMCVSVCVCTRVNVFCVSKSQKQRQII
jgi:hypothetical protein